MHVLVTGATGFIGSHLCRALASAGHTVSAVSRDATIARAKLPMVTRVHQWDTPRSAPPLGTFDGIDAVVNLAGETLQGRWTKDKKRRIRESRVLGTRHLVQGMAAALRRPTVLVSGSASGSYGDRGNEELTEDSTLGHGFLAEVCRDWEQEANAARTSGVRVVSLRSGLVLGRDCGAIKALLAPFKFGLGGPLGNGRQWWPWVHVADEVGVILRALTTDMEGPVNAVAPKPVMQRDFAATFGRVLGRPALFPAPALALRIALGEVSTELLYSRKVLPKRLQAANHVFKFGNLEAALRDFAGT